MMTMAVLMLMLTASAIVTVDSDESDALTDLGNWGSVYGVTDNTSSETKVYTYMSDKFSAYYGKGTFYVKVGTYISMAGDSDGYCTSLDNEAKVHGLSEIPDMNWGAVGGTIAQTGSFSVTFESSGSTTQYEIQFRVVSDGTGDGTVHTMTFDDGEGLQQTMTVLDGSEFELPTGLSGFSKSGYYLKGWYREMSFGNAEYIGGEKMIAVEDITFHALWEELPAESSKILFDDAAPSSWYVGEKYTYKPIENDTVKGIDGWKYLITSLSGSSFSVISAPDWLTLTWDSSSWTVTVSGTPIIGGNFLVHVKVNTYEIWWMVHIPSASDSNVTVTFDTLTDQTISPSTVSAGTVVTLPSKSSVTRTGYILLGWQLPDGKGGNPIYLPGDHVTVTNDVTASAYWIKESDVVVYLSQGRIVGHDIIANGEGMSLRSELSPVPSGYRFIGWMEQDLNDCAYAPGLFMETSGSRYMVAYLVSDDTETFMVTFDANGGSVSITSQEVESGIYVYLPKIMQSSPSGKVFAGWSTERDGTTMDLNKYQVTGDVTLYAVWKDAESTTPDETYHTVWFDANGGSGSFASQTVLEGSVLYDPGIPTRDGYAFLGWTAPGETDYWSFTMDTVQAGMTLSAQWAQHFTVSTDGLKVTVTMCGDYASYQSSVYFGMAGSERDTVNGVASYTFTGGVTVKVTVSTTVGVGSGARIVTSSMPVAVIAPTDPEQPDPKPDPNPDPVDPDDPDDPSSGRVVIPKPFFIITETEDGWFLDANGSSDVKVYRWYIDNVLVHTSSDEDDRTYTVRGLTDGKHTVRLEVESSTGTVNNAPIQTIQVGDGGEGGGEEDHDKDEDDGKDYSTYILIVVIVLFIIGLALVIR